MQGAETRARYSRVGVRARTYVLVMLAVVFFFQAEDGIRDYKVTGVQTCALPIWFEQMEHAMASELRQLMREGASERGWKLVGPPEVEFETDESLGKGEFRCAASRSEERRVGKECRSRWSPYN